MHPDTDLERRPGIWREGSEGEVSRDCASVYEFPSKVREPELRFWLQLLQLCVWGLQLVTTNYLPNS